MNTSAEAGEPPAMPTRRRIVVVLGMHRSGSSAVTRGLAALGVDLGDKIMPAAAGNNEKGFWEDVDINALNDRLLLKAHSHWHRLSPLDRAMLAGPLFSAERREAMALLAAKLKPPSVFAFKDPRTAVLLPFWRCIFDDLDLDVRYLLTVRNPLESAASLLKRDGFPLAKGVALWAKHTVEALLETQGERRLLVSYERLLADPESELHRMAQALGLPIPAPGDAAIAEFRDAFLDNSLRHNAAGAKELERSGAAPPFAVDLFDLVSAMARRPPAPGAAADAARLTAIEAALRNTQPLLSLADEFEDQRYLVEGRLQTSDAKLKTASDTLETLIAEKKAAGAARAALATDLDAARRAFDDLRKTNAAELGMLTDARLAAEERAGAIEADLAEQRAQEATLLRQISEIKSSLDDARREAAVLRRETGAIRRASDAARAALEEERARSMEFSSAARALEEARNAERKETLLARADAGAIKRSTSWRMTAPLRAGAMFVRDPAGATRLAARAGLRGLWRSLPASAPARGRFAGALFKSAPALFGWSSAFRAWRAEQESRNFPAPAPAPPDFFPPLAGADHGAPAPLVATAPPAALSARALAFYLPQFHPIPENNEWWGDGFTEWTKVRPSSPKFEGHYQPHEPGELGYYDLLRDDQVMARQAELARLHGVSGFAFYFYWFAGKRLLEAPLQKWLARRDIDFPFCLVWANENWSRRWDGKSEEILIAQDHSPQDDIAFIAHVGAYMRDPRYIKIGGRPLLVVYRPSLFPDAAATTARWREWARSNGLGEIYLAYTQSFEREDPSVYGFDAAIEFPPNNTGLVNEPHRVKPIAADLDLKIYDWTALVSRSATYDRPSYKLFRGVTPSWDNTPRRPRDGAVLLGSNPRAYKAWLKNAVADTRARFADPDERLIFINAWNEWAEGAHLEPDRRYGYAFLEATRRALDPAAERPKVVIVTHDLNRNGAQFLALNIARVLKSRFGVDVSTIACAPGGDLGPRFAEVGPLTTLDGAASRPEDVEAAIAAIVGEGCAGAIVNSAASAWMAPFLARQGVRMIGLVHELPSVITAMNLGANLKALDAAAESLLFPAGIVRDRSAEAAGLAGWRRADILAQGLFNPFFDGAEAKRAARDDIRRRIGASDDALVVLAVAYGDRRKGPDIFVDWAGATLARGIDAHFVWIGDLSEEMAPVVEAARKRLGSAAARVRFLPFTDDTRPFNLGADIYALCSREDPFPSSALEALGAATPVVMIAGTGGVEDLSASGAVRLAQGQGGEAFVAGAGDWLGDRQARRRAGEAGRDLMRSRFGFTSYCGALADRLGVDAPAVSAIVPNYNYARYLAQRLSSVTEQTLSPREIIVLDDASTDDSVAVIDEALKGCRINCRIVRNVENSGDVFAQWRKGVDLAAHPLVWIAEADDWADPRFLERATKAFARPDVVISYTQSQQADADGRIVAPDYQDYVREVSPRKWTRAFIGEGVAEIRDGLSVKNTLPNVSGAVFRREALARVLHTRRAEIASYRVAGDWCVYVNMLREGALAFTPEALNIHRRHDLSVTIAKFDLADLAEIARMQAYVAREFGLDDAMRRRQGAYLDALDAHFSLATRFSPDSLKAAKAGVAPPAPPSVVGARGLFGQAQG